MDGGQTSETPSNAYALVVMARPCPSTALAIPDRPSKLGRTSEIEPCGSIHLFPSVVWRESLRHWVEWGRQSDNNSSVLPHALIERQLLLAGCNAEWHRVEWGAERHSDNNSSAWSACHTPSSRGSPLTVDTSPGGSACRSPPCVRMVGGSAGGQANTWM